MTNKRTYIAAGLIAITGFLALAFGLPKYQEITSLRAALIDRDNIYTERAQIIQNIKSLATELEDRSADVDKLSKVIPEKKDAPELISAVEDMAAKSGMKLKGITMVEEKLESSPYNIIRLQISTTGDYNSFLGFLTKLEQNLRIIDVSDFELTPNEEDASLSVSITAQAYYLK